MYLFYTTGLRSWNMAFLGVRSPVWLPKVRRGPCLPYTNLIANLCGFVLPCFRISKGGVHRPFGNFLLVYDKWCSRFLSFIGPMIVERVIITDKYSWLGGASMMILIIFTYHYQQEYIVGETERLKSLNTAKNTHSYHRECDYGWHLDYVLVKLIFDRVVIVIFYVFTG